MYENQTEDAIKQRMISNAPPGINTGEGDYFYDAVSPAALELALAYPQLDKILKVGFAETSYGEYLEKITSEAGIYRNPATKGKGQIELTMTKGSQIKIGDVLATQEGNLRFISTEEKTIGDTGKALVWFENEYAGNLGNILANTVFVAPVAIPGFISAKNLLQINAGTDQETDDALRKRYFEQVQTPVTSGNKYHYRNWAKKVPGVGAAKVIPLWNGDNTVKVLIVDANMQPASPALVDKVQEYIDPGASGSGDGEAPIGAYCTVQSAQGLNIVISATINGADVAAVKSDFEAELESYLAKLVETEWVAKPSYSVSYPMIGSLLMGCIAAAGGIDYSDLLMNEGSVNIVVTDNKIAVKGLVTFT